MKSIFLSIGTSFKAISLPFFYWIVMASKTFSNFRKPQTIFDVFSLSILNEFDSYSNPAMTFPTLNSFNGFPFFLQSRHSFDLVDVFGRWNPWIFWVLSFAIHLWEMILFEMAFYLSLIQLNENREFPVSGVYRVHE